MDYRTENQCYWENRAEGYSLVNQTELHTAQHKRWQAHLDAQIRAQHPGKSREEIRVLEVGCGPGFFAIILSELGYAVTAVDYTAHMLEQAGKNAKENSFSRDMLSGIQTVSDCRQIVSQTNGYNPQCIAQEGW